MNNTLIFNRPMNKCQTSCNALGPSDPLNKHLLSPRKNREQVREQIREYVLHMLGAPVIKIELDEQNIQAAIDFALQIFEEYAPREYFQYFVFDSVPGQSVYEMPPDVGFIRNVFYKEMGSFAFQASDLGGALPIEYFYPGSGAASMTPGLIDPVTPIYGQAGTWTLFKQYEQQYSRLASNLGGWEFLGGYNHIKLYPIPFRVHKVIVHYLQRNTDFRQVSAAMQEGSYAFALIVLGNIRSKILNPPGPGGGIQLSGEAMLAKGYELKEKWEERLLNRWSDLPYITMG